MLRGKVSLHLPAQKGRNRGRGVGTERERGSKRGCRDRDGNPGFLELVKMKEFTRNNEAQKAR